MVKIKKKAIDYIKRYCLKNGIYLSTTVDTDRLADFFSIIKPVTTNYELIRIGGEGDGGYLLPDDLEGIKTCFSPGVAKVSEFELELANRGIRSFLADYSVDAPPVDNDLFDFEKKYLGISEGSVYTTLENWIKRKAKNEMDLILQMDIEGAEYSIILNTDRNVLRKFRIIVIEFHRLDALFEVFGFEIVNLAFRRLLSDFEIAHIHPNNCYMPKVYKGFEIPPVTEITFLRKDRISRSQPTRAFPHDLDRANVPYCCDYALPKCWY